MTNHFHRTGYGYITADGQFRLNRITEPTPVTRQLKTVAWTVQRGAGQIRTFDTFAAARAEVTEHYAAEAALEDFNYVGSRHHY